MTAHLLKVRVRNGIIGSFGFDKNGDTTFNPTIIFRAQGSGGKIDRVITLPAGLIP